MKKTSLLAGVVCAAAACGDSTPGPADMAGDTTRSVSVSFAVKVGAQPLDCTQSYGGVGLGKEHIHPGDLRMYVHNLRLVTSAGAEVPVALTADGAFQSADVALLDFTSADGECAGTKETNLVVKGTYLDRGAAVTGLRFTVGVPFAQNHQDVTTARPPLNQSVMFWSWNSGYKFLLLEGKDHLDKAFQFHLGSTGCMKDAQNQVTGCTSPNRVEVNLTGFDPRKSTVVLDLAEILADVNLDAEVACHSSAAQKDCAPLFTRMGLPLGGTNPAPTRVFRVE